MQRKFGMLLVLVLALSLVFCFGATAWADEDAQTPEETAEQAETEETEQPAEAEGEAAEEEAAEGPEESEAAASVFTDVPADHWAYEYIMDIFERKLTTGTSETTFGPDATLTRAQFVTFLGRLAGVDVAEHSTHQSPFADISADANMSWAYGYICWAAEIGVTTGATPTTFNPQGQLTREQMATMVNRFADYYGITLTGGEAVTIADADSISSYAEAGVAALVPTYISLQDGKFNPQVLTNRAEMAQVLSLFPAPEGGFVAATAPADADEEPAADEEASPSEETADEGTADEEAAGEDEAAEGTDKQ